MKDDTPTAATTSASGRKRSSSLGKSLNLATPWHRRDTTAAARAKSETVMKETRDLYAADRGGGGGGKGDEAKGVVSRMMTSSHVPRGERAPVGAAHARLCFGPAALGAANAFEFAEDAGHAAPAGVRASRPPRGEAATPEMRDQLVLGPRRSEPRV